MTRVNRTWHRPERASVLVLVLLLGAGSASARSLDPKAELRQGERLAKRLRVPQAIAKLRRGLELYRGDPSAVADFDLIVRSHLLLAEAHLRRGNEDDGREVLRALARVQPWLELDSKRYPPLFLTLWREALNEEIGKPRGALRVLGPPGRVSINGKALGSAPLRVEQLIVGEHHVVIRGAARDFGWTVSVRASREVVVEGRSGADEPLDLVSPSLTSVSFYGPQSTVAAPPRLLDPRGRAPVAAARPDPNAIPAPLPVVFEQESDSESILSAWWFWTAAGVIIAGGAAAYTLIHDRSVDDVSVEAVW